MDAQRLLRQPEALGGIEAALEHPRDRGGVYWGAQDPSNGGVSRGQKRDDGRATDSNHIQAREGRSSPLGKSLGRPG